MDAKLIDDNNNDEMLDEYDFSGGVRGKYARRLRALTDKIEEGSEHDEPDHE